MYYIHMLKLFNKNKSCIFVSLWPADTNVNFSLRSDKKAESRICFPSPPAASGHAAKSWHVWQMVPEFGLLYEQSQLFVLQDNSGVFS